MAKQHEQPISKVLQAWLDSVRLRPRMHQSSIAALWADLMGPSVAHYTTSIRLDNRILYLQVNSSSLRNELFYNKLQIVEKLNEALGEAYITDAVIR